MLPEVFADYPLNKLLSSELERGSKIEFLLLTFIKNHPPTFSSDETP